MKKIMRLTILLAMFLTFSVNYVFANEHKGDSVRGAELWASSCVHCHNIREPADLSKRAWKYSMNHMRVRAGFTGQETRDILAFILESKTSKDSE